METSRPLQIIESASKIIAFAAAAIGAIGALVTYRVNSAAEFRQEHLAELETDLRVSALFADLVQKANGYGQWSAPNDKIIEATIERLPQSVFEKVYRNDPRSIFALFAGSRIPEPVPLSAEVAAAEIDRRPYDKISISEGTGSSKLRSSENGRHARCGQGAC